MVGQDLVLCSDSVLNFGTVLQFMVLQKYRDTHTFWLSFLFSPSEWSQTKCSHLIIQLPVETGDLLIIFLLLLCRDAGNNRCDVVNNRGVITRLQVLLVLCTDLFIFRHSFSCRHAIYGHYSPRERVAQNHGHPRMVLPSCWEGLSKAKKGCTQLCKAGDCHADKWQAQVGVERWPSSLGRWPPRLETQTLKMQQQFKWLPLKVPNSRLPFDSSPL